VSSTSVTRRNAAHSSKAIAKTAKIAASMIDLTMGFAGLEQHHGRPRRVGSTANTRGHKIMNNPGVAGVALRQHLNPRSPVGAHPESREIGGDIVDRDALGFERVQRNPERFDYCVFELLAKQRVGRYQS
jgi:hypothetical protein